MVAGWQAEDVRDQVLEADHGAFHHEVIPPIYQMFEQGSGRGHSALSWTTTTLLPSNETQLTASSCDASQVGVDTVVLSNVYGCDSLVITTTILLPSNETQLTATSCDVSQVEIRYHRLASAAQETSKTEFADDDISDDDLWG